MKKIGLITYQDIADGKGRFLQAYALYSSIIELGYKVEIIDYYPRGTKKEKVKPISIIRKVIVDPSKLSSYLSKTKSVIFKKYYDNEFQEKRELYNSFIKSNINISNKKYHGYNELVDANLNYDAYICGSDQIWNPNFQGLDPAYYLKFARDDKRIAYAPSMGTTVIDDTQKKIIKKNIEGMKHISVRERSGADIIAEITGKEVENVLDPTLLMSRQWWNAFAGEKNSNKKPYVLTFLFDNNKYPRNVAKNIAQKFGYEIISIPDSFADIFFKSHKELAIGPKEFVNLFKNASFICTQSFHGVILSLIFNRQFYVFNRDIKGSKTSIFSRIGDLLKMLGLENRILKEGESIPSSIPIIDYSEPNKILEEKRQESLNYLSDALSEATGGESDEISSVR